MSGETWALLLVAVVSFATGVVWTLVAQSLGEYRRRERMKRAQNSPFPNIRFVSPDETTTTLLAAQQEVQAQRAVQRPMTAQEQEAFMRSFDFDGD